MGRHLLKRVLTVLLSSCLTGLPQTASIPPELPISFHSFFPSKILQNKERYYNIRNITDITEKWKAIIFKTHKGGYVAGKATSLCSQRRTPFQNPMYQFSFFGGSRILLPPSQVGSCSWQLLETVRTWVLDFTGNACPVSLKLRWSEKEQSGKQASWLVHDGILGWTISGRYFHLSKESSNHDPSEFFANPQILFFFFF